MTQVNNNTPDVGSTTSSTNSAGNDPETSLFNTLQNVNSNLTPGIYTSLPEAIIGFALLMHLSDSRPLTPSETAELSHFEYIIGSNLHKG